MKIASYCQHVLGIGHVHRSLELCRKLAEHYDVTMITGGAPLRLQDESITFLELPGLTMDNHFNNLAPYDARQNLAEVQKQRREILYSFFNSYQPDVFVVELYPFGRKAFRFELDPILEGIAAKKLPSCFTICSLRDILVERHDSDKFEKRALATLNTFFNGLLVHGDPKLIPLDATFSRVAQIQIPMSYTGYVTPQAEKAEQSRIRHELGIQADKGLIVASIGGGNVGAELLYAVVEAFNYLKDDGLQLQIFTGPYAAETVVSELRLSSSNSSSISVDRFSPSFVGWLGAADLAISMAGYNTTMNTLAAGTPALFYPFSRNHEQHLRLSRLAEHVPFAVIAQDSLKADKLALLIQTQLQRKRFTSPFNLDGAVNSRSQIEHWYATTRS